MSVWRPTRCREQAVTMTSFRQGRALVEPSKAHGGKWWVSVEGRRLGAIWSGAVASQYQAKTIEDIDLGTFATLERAVDALLDN